MQTCEEQKAFVEKLNIIDDVFFQKMAEDREVAEEILRIILEKPNLKVIDSKVQRYLRNIGAHSVILDLICEDEDHSIINCEVQKADDDDHQRRVRFNRSNIDIIFVEKGLDYKEIPDVYVIFISRFDTFNENRTIYHIDRVIKETGTVVENGTHEIYVGASLMCKVVEEYAAEKLRQAEIQTASNFLKNGVSVDIVAKSIPSLTHEFIVELSKKILQPGNA